MRTPGLSPRWIGAVALLSLAGLVGCQESAQDDKAAGPDNAAPAPAQQAAGESSQSSTGSTRAAAEKEPVCQDCGTVTAIEEMQTEGKGTGAGAASGAVAGVVIGNQIGSGTGKAIARIVGGIGGAIAGHQAEKKIRSKTFYRVTVSMEAGGTSVIDVPDTSGISVGTSVRVENGNLFLRGN